MNLSSYRRELFSFILSLYIYNISSDFGLNEISSDLTALVDRVRGDKSKFHLGIIQLPKYIVLLYILTILSIFFSIKYIHSNLLKLLFFRARPIRNVTVSIG